MLAFSIHIAAALHGYLALCMPTNRMCDWLRRPPGLAWAIPVAGVAMSCSLFAVSVCRTVVDDGGPGYVNVLVLLFGWNALKFFVLAAVSIPRLVFVDRTRIAKHATPVIGHRSGGSW